MTTAQKTTEKTKQKTNGFSVYRRLIGYSLKYRTYLIIAIIALIAGAMTQTLFAWMIGPLLDDAILKGDPEAKKWAWLWVIGVFLIRGAATFFSGYFLGLIGLNVIKTLRKEVFDKILRMPIHYFESHSSGKLFSYIIYHTEQISNTSIRGITTLVQDTAVIIGLLAVMFYQSWQLSLVMLIVAPAITVLIVYVTKRLRSLSHKVQDSVGDISQIANEMIRGYKTVRIFNGEEYESKRFNQTNNNNKKLLIKRLFTETLSTPVIQIFIGFAVAIIVYIATREATLETLTPGSFMSFIMSMMLLFSPVRNLTQLNAQLQSAIAAGESVFALLDAKTENDTGTLSLPTNKGKVEFRDVSFTYPKTDKPVLNNINFTVNAGEKIAIIGKSGSGKTTLVDLLPRFHDIEKGHILLDNTPINDLKLHSLREQIAYVGQEVILFNDTIKNNIAYSDLHNLPQEQVKQAAKAAHASEFIEKLPEGYDTMIGDNGVLLSGGQRQRIAIARAILSPAPILILDEATSALDSESENYIQDALSTLLENRTTFVIAHRLSTIESADRIIVMEEGKIVEQGKHQELLDRQGKYAHLYKLQLAGAKESKG